MAARYVAYAEHPAVDGLPDGQQNGAVAYDKAASSGFVIDRDALGFIVIQDGGGFDGVFPAGCDVDGDGFVHCTGISSVTALGNQGDDDRALMGVVVRTLNGGPARTLLSRPRSLSRRFAGKAPMACRAGAVDVT